MIWNEYSERLREVLKLEGNPIIAITFSMAPAEGGREGKHWVCGVLQEARDGQGDFSYEMSLIV
jgi:uncharacterized protein (DUF169 family)